MMIDYSNTILGDLMGWLGGWRKCVFCQLKGNLSRVTVDAYSGYEWYYFHDSCLKKVISDPDKYKMFVDFANEINTEIVRYRARQENERLRKELQDSLAIKNR